MQRATLVVFTHLNFNKKWKPFFFYRLLSHTCYGLIKIYTKSLNIRSSSWTGIENELELLAFWYIKPYWFTDLTELCMDLTVFSIIHDDSVSQLEVIGHLFNMRRPTDCPSPTNHKQNPPRWLYMADMWYAGLPCISKEYSYSCVEVPDSKQRKHETWNLKF